MLAVLAVAIGQASPGLAQSASGPAYPDRAVQLVVPYGAGTAADGFARLITQKMSDLLGQQVVVNNKPGASGVIGATSVAKSASDGYTILLASTPTNAIAPSVVANLGYDAIKDFQPIARVVSYPYVLAVSTTLPVQSVTELIAYAKARPGTLNYGSTGEGTGVQLAGALFNIKAGLDMKHIAYNSMGQMAGDLSSGAIHLIFYPYQALVPLIQSGKLRVLGSTGSRRSPSLPDFPTLAEQGVRDYEITAWLALTAPAGTAPDRIERLHDAVRKAVQDPKVAASLKQGGFDVDLANPAEYLEFTKQEVIRYRQLVQASGKATTPAPTPTSLRQ